MKKALLLLILSLFTVHSFGQTTIQTKEIKIPYTNGYEIFRVCATGCQTTFNDKKEYFWYTEFSKVKSTKGGSGGSLLHGNYKFYDENGNLRQDKNYYLGLPDGTEKNWDSLGNITETTKYNKGDIIYLKYQSESGAWVEHIGAILTEGWIKKSYTKYNSLIAEETMLANFITHIKTFYEYGDKKVKEDFYTSGKGSDLTGKYTAYYENGKVKTQGQFYDGDHPNIAVGTWNWYKSDGTLEASTQYKANVEKWSNGENKVTGGYILDTETNTWLKIGEWRWYTEDGKFLSSKKYEWGVEKTE